jgi:hypothetical protein
MLCAGCSHLTPSQVPAGTTPSADVAGLPLTDGPSGPRPDVSHAHRDVLGATDEPADVLAIDSIAEVEDFWSQEYPKAFGSEFHPVDRYQSYVAGEGPEDGVLCGLPPMVNAFYGACPGRPGIAWDRGLLLPLMIAQFGDMAPTLVFAHEYGHAVQHAAHLVTLETPTLIGEQQADCFAGMFMRYLAEGKGKRFTLNTTDGLNDVLAATVSLRDPIPGPQSDEHGSAFDRVTAFKAGFSDGSDGCKKVNKEEIDTRRADLPQIFRDPETGGNLPVTRKSVEILVDSLDKFFALPDKPHVDFGGASPKCPKGKATPPVSYCAETNEIGVDLAGLSERGQPPDGPVDTTVKGDHNAYVLLASKYALAALKAKKASLTGTNAALAVVCNAGAWTAALGTGLSEVITLSAGDLDEAVSGLLTDGLAAADINGEPAGSGFARVDAFEEGVLHGRAACDGRLK